jgi:hypothetical protein
MDVTYYFTFYETAGEKSKRNNSFAHVCLSSPMKGAIVLCALALLVGVSSGLAGHVGTFRGRNRKSLAMSPNFCGHSTR